MNKITIVFTAVIIFAFFSGCGNLGSSFSKAKGGRIAFTNFADNDAEIYIMDPDGKNLANLTKNTAADDEPALSPLFF